MKNVNINQSLGKIAAAALLLASGAAIGQASMAFATLDEDRTTSDVLDGPAVIPYEGFFLLDQKPISGTQSMRFELFAGVEGGAAIWAEEQDVQVYNGRFSLGLGQGTQDTTVNSGRPLADLIRDGDHLYLKVSAEDDGPGCVLVPPATKCWVPLGGRQAIEPSAYAAWTGHSADFQVGGDLNADDDLLVARDATVQGTTYVEGGQLTTTSASPLVIDDDLVIDADGTDIEGLRMSVGGGSRLAFGTNASSSELQLVERAEGLRVHGPNLPLALKIKGSLSFSQDLALGAHALLLEDSFGQYSISAQDALVTGGGVKVRTLTSLNNDDPVFRVISGGGTERLKVEHDGDVRTNNALGVTGSVDSATGYIDGKLTLSGNLNVSGKLTGLNSTGRYVVGSGSSSQIMISTSNGFCYLAKMSIDHDAGNPNQMECRVSVNGSNQWVLSVIEDGGNQGNVECAAYCVNYSAP